MMTKSVHLRLPPASAFELFTARVSDWWPPENRHLNDPTSTLHLLAGGRFYERACDGRELELGKVLIWEPARRIVLDFYIATGTERPTLVEVRFEPDGDGFVFRQNLRAPGFRVSTAERDKFVSDFARGLRIANWGVGVATVILIGAGVWIQLSLSVTWPSYAYFLLILPLIGGFVAWTSWIRNAPVRAISTRAAVAPARSKDEARRIGFERLTWRHFGLAGLLWASLLVRVGVQHNLLEGWYRLFLVATAIVLVLFCVQAYRKFKASSAASADTH